MQQLMRAVPDDRAAGPAAGVPAPAVLEELAARVVAAVSAMRSTWTVWNLRAETERQLRASLPPLPPQRHREVADTVTALAASPALSICVEAPSFLDEPAELRRADGSSVFTQHAATRYTSQAVIDAEARLSTPPARQPPAGSPGHRRLPRSTGSRPPRAPPWTPGSGSW